MHREVWFEIQFSVKGADDWFALGGKFDFDTFDAANNAMAEKAKDRAGDYDLRVVKKTLTEEPVCA